MSYYPMYYGHGSCNLPCSDNLVQKVSRCGFALIEIMIVVAIIGTLSAIAVPNYLKYREKGKIALALTDIRIIEKTISIYVIDTGGLPDSFIDLPINYTIDPWGNPYQYLRIDGGDVKGKMRKDHFNASVNTDYDLYSMGRDGKSKLSFKLKASQDDVVRANNGGFVGLVSDY